MKSEPHICIFRLASTALLLITAFSFAKAADSIPETATPSILVSTKAEPVTQGKFAPNWQSLEQYQTPEWFRNAKFGIWAHWGPQCQAEDGDWYARKMYQESSAQYQFHLKTYGHPSTSGFKDVIHQWKAEKWDPERLVALYKRVGAQYFLAMANHHDNFDNWDSKYQPWNSVNIGPKKDIIEGWAKAAKANGLPFGVSIHASHAWTWYEPAQRSDQKGDLRGVPYDGKLTKADGKGQWWSGLDPQDLYAQNHPLSANSGNFNAIHSQWNWGNGASQPDAAYCEKFYNRTVDLINHYHPDLLYFDDTALPLWPISDAGLKIAAHFYNSNMRWHHGALCGVIFGKILNERERKAITWDIERGIPSSTLPFAWQTDTCIGSWHYDRIIYKRNSYKRAKTVIQMLADIVSKNGNLLLNIPIRGDGSIDEREERILEGIGAWMNLNKEGILGTRPWKIFGEGPASEGAALSGQGFNEGKGKPFTAEDIRFTIKENILYAIVLGRPAKPVQIKSLGKASHLLTAQIASVRQLGSQSVPQWSQSDAALTIEPAQKAIVLADTVVFKITTKQ